MIDIALIIIALLSCIAVLHSGFSDNLLQRIGLALTCAGALFTLASSKSCHENAVTMLLCGVAIYAIGTAKNAVKYRHHRRVRHEADNELHA